MKQAVIPTIGIALLCAVSAIALASTEGAPVASVVDVIKDAFHTPPGGAELAAKVGDQLLADEAIRTGPDSAIEMNFPDGATLRLEADSDLVLDTYVFDPNALKSAANISVPSGIARYTTGGVSTDDTGVQFVTPVATVGIRGTDIVVSVGTNGETVIDVLTGKVTAKPNKSESVAEAEEGQSMYARIYGSAYGLLSKRGTAVFARPDVNWPRIRAGFDDLVQRYPDSTNLNTYARLACISALDKKTTAQLLQRIAQEVEPQVWQSRSEFMRCQNWSREASP